MTSATYYRWRKEYGGAQVDQLKRLKELEKENERLRHAVSDLTFDKLILNPAKQPKQQGRLWFNDESCIRLKAEHANHVWSYDFVHERTHDGHKFRTLNIIDEFTRECLAIKVKHKLNSRDVIDALSDLFLAKGIPCLSAQTMGLNSLHNL